LNTYGTGLKLRDAAYGDAKLLFDWANDESVRNNSINQEPITWENHLNWFREKLNDTGTKILILENNDLPVGQMRVVMQEGCWTINYSVDKNFRGKGYGKKIVLLTLEKYPGDSFRATVKKENIASKKVFENLGFKSLHSDNDSLCLYEYRYK